MLRPGDIDVIAAIGDSLTAGNGGMSTNALQVTVESKGLRSYPTFEWLLIVLLRRLVLDWR
jgi:hypothetical protein